MKLVQLVETFDNLFSKDVDKRQQYASTIHSMLQNAYASIGGLKGAGFNSPDDMIANIPMWKVFRRGNDVKAVMMYKDTNGRKRVAMATDGSIEGKSVLAKMIADEYNHGGRSYAEISGGSLNFHKKILGDKLDAITIPSSQVAGILDMDPSEIRIVSDTEYQRQLGGDWITKRMVGTIGKNLAKSG